MRLRQRRKRKKEKEYFNEHHQIRQKNIKTDNLILLHNIQREKNMTKKNKLTFK